MRLIVNDIDPETLARGVQERKATYLTCTLYLFLRTCATRTKVPGHAGEVLVYDEAKLEDKKLLVNVVFKAETYALLEKSQRLLAAAEWIEELPIAEPKRKAVKEGRRTSARRELAEVEDEVEEDDPEPDDEEGEAEDQDDDDGAVSRELSTRKVAGRVEQTVRTTVKRRVPRTKGEVPAAIRKAPKSRASARGGMAKITRGLGGKARPTVDDDE